MRGWQIVVLTHKDDLEEHFLIDLHKLLVPLVNVGSLLARVGVILIGSGRVTLMMSAPLDYFLENGFVDLEYS